MGEDGEEAFFSLEDDEAQASVEEAPSNPSASTDVLEDVVVLDTEIISQATGCYTVEWQLIGMDCPDCAGKAMTALRSLPQVSAPNVSATRGDVKLQLDLERGSLAQVSSALRSLGHAPDTEHHHLKGVKAESVAKRNSTTLRDLKRLFCLQPGILDALSLIHI